MSIRDTNIIVADIEPNGTLELLCGFAENASSQDYNEDRVLSWIAVVTAQARLILSKTREASMTASTPPDGGKLDDSGAQNLWFTLQPDGCVYCMEKTGEHTAKYRVVCRHASVDDSQLIARAPQMAEEIISLRNKIDRYRAVFGSLAD